MPGSCRGGCSARLAMLRLFGEFISLFLVIVVVGGLLVILWYVFRNARSISNSAFNNLDSFYNINSSSYSVWSYGLSISWVLDAAIAVAIVASVVGLFIYMRRR